MKHLKNQNKGQKLVLRKTELRVLNEIELGRVAGGRAIEDPNETEACGNVDEKTNPIPTEPVSVYCFTTHYQLTALCPNQN